MRPFRLDVHVGPGDFGVELVNDARGGLTSTPKELQPKYFYDAAGSAMFEEITRTPEYYQTRTERTILESIAGDLIASNGIAELVELGAGSARKTEVLLAAIHARANDGRFIAFDVDPHTLVDTAGRLAAQLPGLDVHAVAGDFERHLSHIPPRQGPRLVVFLGGTLGNFSPAARGDFVARLGRLLEPGDRVLIGHDLVGDISRIEAAYNDAGGVTDRFNLNALTVLNRELDGDFDVSRFRHVARYNPDCDCMEMFLRSEVDQTVTLARLGLRVEFVAGEKMRTEISCKFTREAVDHMYAAAGLRLVDWYPDERDWFACSLAALA